MYTAEKFTRHNIIIFYRYYLPRQHISSHKLVKQIASHRILIWQSYMARVRTNDFRFTC